MDERFSQDEEIRFSGEQRIKLEIIKSLREHCDRKTYGQKLKEAAQKLGKSERTVRRLLKAWQENGLAALAEVPRGDKGQTRKSEYWYNLTIKTYKVGNKGSDRMTRTQVAEKVTAKAYEFAKNELRLEISQLEDEGFRGEELDWKIETLIKIKEKTGGFDYWKKYGKPPCSRSIERWLKPFEEKKHKSRISRSPGWHGSEHVIRTRDGQIRLLDQILRDAAVKALESGVNKIDKSVLESIEGDYLLVAS